MRYPHQRDRRQPWTRRARRDSDPECDLFRRAVLRFAPCGPAACGIAACARARSDGPPSVSSPPDGARPAPRRVFDTQIAAALLGLGDQIGYADLLARILGVRISKAKTRTDWGQRPLTQGQIAYALDDVRYLHTLRARLGERLVAKDRV